MTQWDRALNLVDAKIQDLRHMPFEQLAKRPYRSELPESNDTVCYTLFVDPISESSLRVVLQARSSAGSSQTFAHGFDMHKDGHLSELAADVLWEFS